MAWKSFRFRCGVSYDPDVGCGHIWDDLIQHDQLDVPIECPTCGAVAGNRIPYANIATASFVDGTNRFQDIKTMRELDKITSKANKAGDKETAKKAKQEKEWFRGK